MKRCSTSSKVALFGGVAFSLISTGSVYAANHWLSGVRGASQGNNYLAARTSATSVFDLTISLDTNPLGDDDSTADSGPDDDDQNAFEERIKQFSNAVYQATNGAHQIGKVTIYRDKALYNSVDVQWKENCGAKEGPRATPSAFGKSSGRIYMCTNWTGASSLMPTDKGSGYTLAHEWGHYTYGLYDEYASGTCTKTGGCRASKPLATDTAAIPSIMNNQWRAARATASDADYLEFSTANIAPFDGSGGTNAQFRVYGESGWATLARNTNKDPKRRGAQSIPQRTHYSSLTAPVAPNFIVNDSEATAQDQLDIQWVSSQTVALTIDRSGSMSGTPIANAKTASNLLIDQLKNGESSIGVVSFNSSVSQNYPITAIPEPDAGIKSAAKSAVNGISATSLTALYDGLAFTLGEVESFGTSGAVVYVLADGDDNSSTETEASVTSAYKTAGVPIIAFGYGSGAPGGSLSRMASATGGAYYQSPTTLAEIQAAFVDANANFSSNQLLVSDKQFLLSGTSLMTTIPLDSTLGSVSLNATFAGSSDDIELKLLDPAGSDTNTDFTCVVSGGDSSCTAALGDDFFAANGRGDFSLEVTNISTGDYDVATLVSALPLSSADPYTLSVGTGDGLSTLEYPAPFVINATTQTNAPITNVTTEATITAPDGTVTVLALMDDGLSADILESDGTYGGIVDYDMDGQYDITIMVTNESGSAETTFESVLTSVQEDGTNFTPESEAIVENFIRTSSFSVNVQNVQADDHADDLVAANCTLVSDDNFDHVGRIDVAGDIDCFHVVPSSVANDLIFRVTGLSREMDPILSVFDAAGATEVLTIDLATSENEESGVVARISAETVDAAGYILSVTHTDATAVVGGYNVSVGSEIVTDTPLVVAPVEDDTSDDDDDSSTIGGASISPISIMFLLGLLLLKTGFLRRK